MLYLIPGDVITKVLIHFAPFICVMFAICMVQIYIAKVPWWQTCGDKIGLWQNLLLKKSPVYALLTTNWYVFIYFQLRCIFNRSTILPLACENARLYTSQTPEGMTAGEKTIVSILREKFPNATDVQASDISGKGSTAVILWQCIKQCIMIQWGQGSSVG